MEEILEWLYKVFSAIITVLSIIYLSLYYYGDSNMLYNFLFNTVLGGFYLYVYYIFYYSTEFVSLLLYFLPFCMVCHLLCGILSGLLNTLLRYASFYLVSPLILTYHFFTYLLGFFSEGHLVRMGFGFYFYVPAIGITISIYGCILFSMYEYYISDYQKKLK